MEMNLKDRFYAKCKQRRLIKTMENPDILDLREQSQRGGTNDEDNLLLNSMNVNVIKYLLDEELTILWGNRHFFSRTGYSEEEYKIRFKNMRQYYGDYPQDFQSLKKALSETMEKNDKGTTLPLRLPAKDGTFRWNQFSMSVTGQNIDGIPVIYAIGNEIDDVILCQEEHTSLYEGKVRELEWLMDAYVGNIYISDMETYELLFMNRTALETIKHRREDYKGHKCYEIIQGRKSPCPFCTNDRITKDKFYDWEFYNPVLEKTFMIKDRIIVWNGHECRIELSHDMYSTEYKLAKKDRERDAIINTIPGSLVRIDARDMSTVLWYGNGFLEIIGYTKEQFEKELNSQFTYIHPDDMERVKNGLDEIRNNGKNLITEARIITRSGSIKVLTMTLSYINSGESWDGIPSFYNVGIDVTKEREEQERQRQSLEDAYQAARVANSAKTNFLSSMSHDIRTPMNAIMGMAAIAKINLNSPEKVNHCLNKINTSSRHLLSLINEVLDMSKIESGKIDLIPEIISLPELFQNVMDICRPLIQEKKQEFRISVGLVRHEKVVADGDRLKQVFMNILSNSIKYTPEGGSITLRIDELSSSLSKKGQYEFIFSDNGIGIPEEYIPHIFEPFSRAEDSRISRTQGTGLGMAITENIVRMMNGTIEVQSELGSGSQFIVSLPLEPHLEEESCDEQLCGHPVLVVDDDQIVCENAAALLNELGMRGYWVLSGREAVWEVEEAHIRKDDFFAVIIDWKMPGMDGLETVKAIRNKLKKNVPIIIISAYDYSDIEEEFIKAGADAFITKPLFKSKMLHILQLFCSSNQIDAVSDYVKETRSTLTGRRILLAEDNDLNREIVVELLQMQGMYIDTAENGKYAVNMFSESEPGEYAVILMDLQMPVMDGYEATAAIRSLNRIDATTIPIIALTANAFASDVGKARSVGMNDHVAKPIDVEHLIDILQNWIN